MDVRYAIAFSALLGVVFIITATIILLPNRKRVPTYITVVAAILAVLIGVFFLFRAIELYAG